MYSLGISSVEMQSVIGRVKNVTFILLKKEEKEYEEGKKTSN